MNPKIAMLRYKLHLLDSSFEKYLVLRAPKTIPIPTPALQLDQLSLGLHLRILQLLEAFFFQKYCGKKKEFLFLVNNSPIINQI